MKPTLPEPESYPQNGGGGGGGLAVAEPGGGAGPEETAAANAAPSLSHEQPQDFCEAGAAAPPKGPEEPERPLRRSFQIPRKSREKKGGASSPTPSLSPFHLSVRTSLSPLPTRETVNKHSAPPAAARCGRKAVEARSAAPCAPWKLEVAQVGSWFVRLRPPKENGARRPCLQYQKAEREADVSSQRCF